LRVPDGLGAYMGVAPRVPTYRVMHSTEWQELQFLELRRSVSDFAVLGSHPPMLDLDIIP
jgi:hypothetical protein